MADRYFKEIQLVKGKRRLRLPMMEPDVTLHLLGDLMDSVVEGKEAPMTGEDGLEAVRMAEACCRFSETSSKLKCIYSIYSISLNSEVANR